MSEKEKKQYNLKKNIPLIIITIIVSLSIITIIINYNYAEKQNISEYISSIEFDQYGNLLSIESDEKLGKLIWEARQMQPLEQIELIVERNSDDIDNKLQRDEGLSMLYVMFPKEFVELYGHDRFREFQIVEINYRYGLGHTMKDFQELAELQQRQFEESD